MAQIDKLVESARPHLESGETVIASVMGAYEAKMLGKDTVRNGVFLATDRRLVFYSKKLTGYDMEVFPYSSISSIEMGKDFMGHRIAFFASGNKVAMKWINAGDVHKFIQVMNQGITGKISSDQYQASAVTNPNDLIEPTVKSSEYGLKNNSPNAEPPKKPFWKLWWVWAAVILLFVAVYSGSDKQDTNVPVNQNGVNQNISEKDTSRQKAIPGSLGLTSEEFRQRFNGASIKIDAGFEINDFEIQSGEVQDSFQGMLTNNIGIIGTINKKDGSVRDVMILAQGDGTLKSGTDIIMAMGTIITAFNPEFAPDDRGKVLTDLGLLKDNSDINNLKGDTIRGKYKYWISSSPSIGIMFGVKDKNDN